MSQLKSMLNNIINENSGQAELDLHAYLTQKIREVVGLTLTEGRSVSKKLSDKAEVDVQYDKHDGEYQGYIWIKCDSKEKFHEILKGQNEIQQFVEKTLGKVDLSLMGIEDYEEPEAENGGFYMNFRAYG